jgi:hypothetical protein
MATENSVHNVRWMLQGSCQPVGYVIHVSSRLEILVISVWIVLLHGTQHSTFASCRKDVLLQYDSRSQQICFPYNCCRAGMTK